ncbi:MAG: zonular occludens toxin domain-containing protein [Candidatus Electrothrix scaldis]|nr:MAG: zonular occludens toxin domain-containing protein [Candidatus Electrothrix sp. GW3-3]
MAIRIVDGVLGAGKTYYSVNWLATNYCKKISDDLWILDPEKKIRIITNIEGLKLPHEDFNACLKKAGGLEVFFTKEYQAIFSGDAHLIYILDEAQQWFRPRYCKLTHETLLYFEWSRHEGHDIWFVTQSYKKVTSEVACLAECIISAQPRTLSVTGREMTYVSRTFGGVELETHRLFYSKSIGNLYQSSKKDESVKIKNPIMRRYMLALLVAVVLMFFGFRSSYNYWKQFMGTDEQKSSASTEVSSSVPEAEKVASSSASSSAPVSSSPVSSSAESLFNKKSKHSTDFYMYRLDMMYSKAGMSFLLGMSWIPRNVFPYKVVRKGYNYFAVIPSYALPAFEDSSRAIPVDFSH